MKRILEVCLIIVAGAVTLPAAAQSSPEIPTLRPGIRVEMAATSTARPAPDADQLDAFVLTVTYHGSVYEGTNAISPSALTEEITHRIASRQQKLYIKADGRATYASVSRVLRAAQASGIEAPILLTAQQGVAPTPGTITPPEGMEVLIGSALPPGTVATVVELYSSAKPPMLKINNDQTPWSALPSTLMRHFQKGDGKVVLLKADIGVPFADVVHVIDACRSADARVFLVPEGSNVK